MIEPGIHATSATHDQPLGMAPAAFAREFRHQRPLLVRAASRSAALALEPDDLAGLACEESIHARLMTCVPGAAPTRRDGPFCEADFAATPASHWWLEVDDVDKWDMDVARLWQRFDFLPAWRCGSVGVRYMEAGAQLTADEALVERFVLQGSGACRVALGAAELELQAADLLYLPARANVSFEATRSGLAFMLMMHAPLQAELAESFAAHLLATGSATRRFHDAGEVAASRGEIDRETVAALRAELGDLAAPRDDTELAHWFGRFITRHGMAHGAAPPDLVPDAAALERALAAGAILLRHPWSRFVWHGSGDKVNLIVAGTEHAVSARFARAVCDQFEIRAGATLDARDFAVTLDLVRNGHLLLGSRA